MTPMRKPTEADRPEFSRPLEAHLPTPLATNDRFFRSTMVLFCLPTTICIALMILARPNNAQNLPAAATHPTGATAAGSRSGLQLLARNEPKRGLRIEPAAPATPGRRPLTYYTGGVRSSMFNAPQPPAAPEPKVTPPPPPHVDPKPPVVPVMPINPFADWSYTGTVQMGDVTMALLENSKTKEGQYVKPGATFLGAQVTSVSADMVVLDAGGKPTQLTKSANITMTPLDRNAAFLGGQAPTPAPNAAPQPPTPTPGLAVPTETITLPNGRVLEGDRAARYKRFMEMGFQGNLGGWGGGRGGRNGGASGGQQSGTASPPATSGGQK